MADIVDRLTSEVDALIAKIDALDPNIAKARHQVIVTHDDGNDDGDDGDEIDASSPSADYDGDDNNGDDDDEDDDDEPVEKRAPVFAKLGTPGPGPHDVTGAYQQSNSEADRPGQLSTSRHKTQQPITSSESFDSVIHRIMERDSTPYHVAMATARLEAPRAFREYQSGGAVTKSAPSFDARVESEMFKHHVTREVAQQRIINTFGSTAMTRDGAAMAKRAEALEEVFTAQAEDLWADDARLDRCSALREIRKRCPALFKKLQSA
jgi:hypothetical protein